MLWINSWDTHSRASAANDRKNSTFPFNILKTILASKHSSFSMNKST